MTPDDDLAAAEYALGTLSPGERATLAARRLSEADLDAAIRAWEARLAPLAEAAAPIEPAADFLPAIEARIRTARPLAPASAAASATAREPDHAVAEWRRRAARWRTAAIAASSVAALLAVGLAVRETGRSSAPRQYVAILQKDAASPAFEVTVDLDRQEFSVSPLAASPPPGKSYELWIIDPRLGPPKSLGVIDEARRGASLGSYDRAIVEGATYAVTVEPPGGSPDGKPSGRRSSSASSFRSGRSARSSGTGNCQGGADPNTDLVLRSLRSRRLEGRSRLGRTYPLERPSRRVACGAAPQDEALGGVLGSYGNGR